MTPTNPLRLPLDRDLLHEAFAEKHANASNANDPTVELNLTPERADAVIDVILHNDAFAPIRGLAIDAKGDDAYIGGIEFLDGAFTPIGEFETPEQVVGLFYEHDALDRIDVNCHAVLATCDTVIDLKVSLLETIRRDEYVNGQHVEQRVYWLIVHGTPAGKED